MWSSMKVWPKMPNRDIECLRHLLYHLVVLLDVMEYATGSRWEVSVSFPLVRGLS